MFCPFSYPEPFFGLVGDAKEGLWILGTRMIFFLIKKRLGKRMVPTTWTRLVDDIATEYVNLLNYSGADCIKGIKLKRWIRKNLRVLLFIM